MLESFLIGGGFAFAAALQPGPLQAFLLASAARNGWKRTLPASCSPLLSDGPIALVALFVLHGIPSATAGMLQAAGGVFLLYLSWAAFRQWKHQTAATGEKPHSIPRTLLHAVTVNILNPNPYIGWSLVMGPAVTRAWHQGPTNAAVLIGTFYGTMITVMAATVFLFGATRFLGPGRRRTLILASAIVLAALGVYQLAAGLAALG